MISYFYKPFLSIVTLNTLKTTGLAAFCKLGEICKHMSALLYYITSEIREERNKSCKSKFQAWSKPSKGEFKKYTAKPLVVIRMQKATSRTVMLFN